MQMKAVPRHQVERERHDERVKVGTTTGPFARQGTAESRCTTSDDGRVRSCVLTRFGSGPYAVERDPAKKKHLRWTAPRPAGRAIWRSLHRRGRLRQQRRRRRALRAEERLPSRRAESRASDANAAGETVSGGSRERGRIPVWCRPSRAGRHNDGDDVLVGTKSSRRQHRPIRFFSTPPTTRQP